MSKQNRNAADGIADDLTAYAWDDAEAETARRHFHGDSNQAISHAMQKSRSWVSDKLRVLSERKEKGQRPLKLPLQVEVDSLLGTTSGTVVGRLSTVEKDENNLTDGEWYWVITDHAPSRVAKLRSSLRVKSERRVNA